MAPRQQETSDLKALVTYIEERTEELFKQRRNAWEFHHPKMLNEMKICMANMEWYKKCTTKHGGYYDHYKSGNEMAIKAQIGRYRDTLTVYWVKKAMEIEKMPKREGENAIRSRYRYGGMNYRRMFEPLDIADHYRQGKREYQKEGNRSEHFKLLEQWGKNDKARKRKKASSMTEDSCFWARVEEAALYCRDFKDGKISPECATRDLDEFEKYVMSLIRSYAASPEIFLKGSSFIRCWKAYMEIKGDSYESELKTFMEKENLEDGSNVLKEYSNLS